MKYKVTGWAMIPVAVEIEVEATSVTTATNLAKTRLMMDENKADYIKPGSYDLTDQWDLRKPKAEAFESFASWTHPDWDGKLILEIGKGEVAKEYLFGGDSDPALLKSTVVEMTRSQFEALGEFEG